MMIDLVVALMAQHSNLCRVNPQQNAPALEPRRRCRYGVGKRGDRVSESWLIPHLRPRNAARNALSLLDAVRRPK